MKLHSLLGALSLAFAVIIFIPSQSLAKGSDDKGSKGSYDKGSKGSYDKECPVGTVPLKGSSDKGSKGSSDKGSKGSSDKGSKGSSDKGSKGSSDKGSKGSSDKGSKGSSDKIKCVPIVPAPVLTGSIAGTIYEDVNNNLQQDNNETGVANIAIEVIDSNGNIISIITDAIGNYSINNLPLGITTVTVNLATLPPLATITSGLNSNDVTVIANTTSAAGVIGYFIPIPVVGSITGQVKNSRIGISAVIVKITDMYNNIHTVITDINGVYTATNIPVGTASVLIIDTSVILLTGLTGTYVPALSNGNPTSVMVIENITVDAGSDFYQ